MSARKRRSIARDSTTTDHLDPRDLARIQELFHGLIRARAREGGLDIPTGLPDLHPSFLHEPEPAWFAVPGMAGGFAYHLSREGREIQLIAESWSRVAGGSGMRHAISTREVILLEEGFV